MNVSAFGVEDSRLSKADGDQFAPAPPRRKVRAGSQYAEGVIGGGLGGALAANVDRVKDLHPATLLRHARVRPHLTGLVGTAGAAGGVLGAAAVVHHRKQHPEKYGD